VFSIIITPPSRRQGAILCRAYKISHISTVSTSVRDVTPQQAGLSLFDTKANLGDVSHTYDPIFTAIGPVSGSCWCWLKEVPTAVDLRDNRMTSHILSEILRDVIGSLFTSGLLTRCYLHKYWRTSLCCRTAQRCLVGIMMGCFCDQVGIWR
jgi:hypothetical protein